MHFPEGKKSQPHRDIFSNETHLINPSEIPKGTNIERGHLG